MKKRKGGEEEEPKIAEKDGVRNICWEKLFSFWRWKFFYD